MGGLMSGLDIHYDLGAGHPLLGRRMPDLEVNTESGPVRVFTLLHEARPVLLDHKAVLLIQKVEEGHAGCEWKIVPREGTKHY
jgi:hypothetical protein